MGAPILAGVSSALKATTGVRVTRCLFLSVVFTGLPRQDGRAHGPAGVPVSKGGDLTLTRSRSGSVDQRPTRSRRADVTHRPVVVSGPRPVTGHGHQ